MSNRPTFHALLITSGFLLIALAACSLPPDAPTPPAQSPTAPVAATQAPTLTASPTDEATPILPTHAPTNTPPNTVESGQLNIEGEVVDLETPASIEDETIPTPETDNPLHPDLGDLPEASIQIFKPGPLSLVASPFRVVADLEPGPEPTYLVTVELFGEDGRLLTRKLLRAAPLISLDHATLITEMEFEIRAVAETGRVVISTEDEFGRPRALSSVDVILVSKGETNLNAYKDVFEDIVIQQPAPFRMIQSEAGQLIVTGLVRQNGSSPLLIELIDEHGKVVGFGNAPYIESDEGEYGLFVGEVQYNVAEPTWVRLIVKSQGGRVPGITHITSMEVVVSP